MFDSAHLTDTLAYEDYPPLESFTPEILVDFLGMSFVPITIYSSGELPLPYVFKDPCLVVNGSELFMTGTQGANDFEDLRIPRLLGELLPEGLISSMNFCYFGAIPTEFPDELPRPGFCAPGVIYDTNTDTYVAVVQTDCFDIGGQIELMKDFNDGSGMHHVETLFRGVPGTETSLYYDPHPYCWLNEDGSISFGMTLNIGPGLRRSNIYVARSLTNSPNGPYELKGEPIYTGLYNPIQDEEEDQEWNMEGTDVAQLSQNVAAMLVVSFVRDGSFGSNGRGTQQRVGCAFAKEPTDRFRGLNIPLVDPAILSASTGREITETGHAAWVTDRRGLLYEEDGYIFFTCQGRTNQDWSWKYYLVSVNSGHMNNLAGMVIGETR